MAGRPVDACLLEFGNGVLIVLGLSAQTWGATCWLRRAVAQVAVAEPLRRPGSAWCLGPGRLARAGWQRIGVGFVVDLGIVDVRVGVLGIACCRPGVGHGRQRSGAGKDPFDLAELLVGVSAIQTCNSFSYVNGLGVSII